MSDEPKFKVGDRVCFRWGQLAGMECSVESVSTASLTGEPFDEPLYGVTRGFGGYSARESELSAARDTPAERKGQFRKRKG